MEKVINIFKRAGLSVAVMAAILVPVLLLVPGINDIKIDIHGWGWAIAIVSVIGLSIAQGFLGGFCKGLFSPSEEVATFVDESTDWVVFALALFVTAAIAPALASYSSFLGILSLSLLIGVASASGDFVTNRVFGKRA